MLRFVSPVGKLSSVSKVSFSLLVSVRPTSTSSTDAPYLLSNSLVNSTVAALTSAPSTDSTSAWRFTTPADILGSADCSEVSVCAKKLESEISSYLYLPTTATWLVERRGVVLLAHARRRLGRGCWGSYITRGKGGAKRWEDPKQKRGLYC